MSPSASDAAELRLFEAYLARVASGVEAGLARGAAQDRLRRGLRGGRLRGSGSARGGARVVTLAEKIKKAEAMGLRLTGFYVSPDVYEELGKKIPSAFAETLGKPGPLLMIVPTRHLRARSIAPMFDCPPDRQDPWPFPESIDG